MSRTITSILFLFIFFDSSSQTNGILGIGITPKNNTRLSITSFKKKPILHIDIDNLKGKSMQKDSVIYKFSPNTNPSSTIFTGIVSLPANTSIGTVSSTEIGYIAGVTDNIQNQLNTKANINNPIFTGTVSGITKSMVGLGNVDNLASATFFSRENHTGTQPASSITGLGSVASLNFISLENNVTGLLADANIASAEAWNEGLKNANNIVSGQSFKGNWNASSNTPTLSTTPSANGDYYIVSATGSQSITGISTIFSSGDKIISNGTNWVKVTQTLVKNLISNANNPTEIPDYKGQIGIYRDDSFNETYFVARSLNASQKWEMLYNKYELNKLITPIITETYTESFLYKSRIISKISDEKYSHSSYPVLVGDTVYISYMYNLTSTIEGGSSQNARLAKFNLYDNNSSISTFNSVTIGDALSGGGFIGGDISVPNLIKKSDGNLRIIFRQGSNQIYYKDFNVSTKTFSAISKVKCQIQNETNQVDLNFTNANTHLNYLFGSGHGIGDSNDLFITSDIINQNDTLWTALSVGSGLGKTTTSILARSTNEGITWMLFGAADSRLLKGLTGTDTKYMWEGAVAIEKDTVFMYCRAVNNGMQKVKAAKTNLYSFSAPEKIWDSGNSKPMYFSLPNIGRFILVEGLIQMQPNIESNRTSLDLIAINPKHSIYTKRFTIRDWQGVHTPSYFILNGTVYISFTTGLRKLHPKNCSEIQFSKLERRFLK